MRARLIAQELLDREDPRDPAVGNSVVADMPESSNIPSSVGGVGSHDIGGVIDSEVVTEVPAEILPAVADDKPPDLPDRYVAWKDVESDLVVPPITGEWKTKGDNKWKKKDKYSIGYKQDPISHRLPRMGRATGPSLTSIGGSRWISVRFRSGETLDFNDDQFVPIAHRSEEVRGYHERLSKEDWVGTVIYLKHGIFIKVADKKVAIETGGDTAASFIAKPKLMCVRACESLESSKTSVAMSDVLDGKDIMFSGQHADLIFQIEQQAERYAEVVAYEEQAAKRQLYVAKHGRCANTQENIDMAGLTEPCSVGLSSRSYDDVLLQKYANSAPRTAAGKHRQRINGAVAPSLLSVSPVKRNEFLDNPLAMEAYWKECNNLESKEVFQYESLAEWDDASRQARIKGEEIHFGYLFGFMVEKRAEYLEGDPMRKFKYRIVFRGNDVKDQNWDVALFQEMASTPTTLEASRYSDLFSMFEGNSMEGRDVEQAYLQAKLEGPATYIQLPK